MEVLSVIINGKSYRRKKTLVRRYLDALEKLPYELDIQETTDPRHATQLAQQAFERNVTHFACVGGDGTNFEILNGLFPAALSAPKRPKLALLPLGTGNSFLKDFSLHDPMHSLRALEHGKMRTCDIIEVVHTHGVFYFMNLLSLGFVADVAFLRNRSFAALGTFGYVLAVMAKTAALRATSFDYSVAGVRRRVDRTFLSFNNSKYTGGNMMMAPLADTGDGKLDLISAEPMKRSELLATFPKIFTGKHLAHRGVTCEQISSLEFHDAAVMPVMVDGETLEVAIQKLRVLPQVLEVFA